MNAKQISTLRTIVLDNEPNPVLNTGPSYDVLQAVQLESIYLHDNLLQLEKKGSLSSRTAPWDKSACLAQLLETQALVDILASGEIQQCIPRSFMH